MKCFNHSSKDAVTFCKACSRALCHDCLEDITFGFACKDENCISRAKMLNAIIDNNIKIVATANNQIKTARITGWFVGVGFIIFAIISYFQLPGSFLPYFLAMFGIATLIPNVLRSKKQLYPEIKK